MSAKRARDEGSAAEDEYVLTYFGVFARGPSVTLALAHSGLSWRLEHPADWGSMKATTDWGCLPLLEAPGGIKVGHEAAILNYLGRAVPNILGGASDADFSTSQQLLEEAEDIYQKLAKYQSTCMAKSTATDEENEKLWANAEKATHSKNFGLPVYLGLLEAFRGKCSAEEGKFTKSGCTVGECKLFAVLHILKMIKDDVLDPFAGLVAFYQRFAATEETKGVLAGTLNMPGPFKPYFIA